MRSRLLIPACAVAALAAGLTPASASAKRLTADAKERIRAYPWPGNVRELRNELKRAFIMSEGAIELEGLTPEPHPVSAPQFGAQHPPDAGDVSLDESERQLILATLERCGGDKKRAAEVLGVSLKTLYNRLHLYARARPVPGVPGATG